MDTWGSAELDPNDPANITISVRQFNRLVAAEDELNRLIEAGVDNWEGY